MGNFSGQGLINELAVRLRDPSNVAYPRATVLNVLNYVQYAVNVRLGLVHNTATLTTGNQALYATTSFATDYIYPVQIFDANNEEIDLVPYTTLVHQDRDWLRAQGNRVLIAAPIGRELLALTPIPYQPQTLTIRYVKKPKALADDAGTADWPDEYKPLVLDLAEALLLLRGRYWNGIQEAISRAAQKLSLDDAAQLIRRGTPGEKQG